MSKIRDTGYGLSDVLGLIAGEGRLPFLVAAGAKKEGLKVICVGLAETTEYKLADEVDVFYRVALARPGAWIRKLRKHSVTRTIMVGRVSKGRLFTPWRILRYLPDWRRSEYTTGGYAIKINSRIHSYVPWPTNWQAEE